MVKIQRHLQTHIFPSLFKNKRRPLPEQTTELIEKEIGIMQSDIHLLKAAIEEAEKKYGKKQDAYEMLNTLIFIRLSMIDIMVLHNKVRNSSGVEQNVMARMLALHLYEFLDDIGQVLGRIYTKGVAGLNVDDDLKKLRVIYNEVKTEVIPKLKDIRHMAAAHKDRDAIMQLKLIEQLDVGEVEVCSYRVRVIFMMYMSFEKQLRKAIKIKMNSAPGDGYHPSSIS